MTLIRKKTAPRQSRVESAYGELKRRIMDNTYPPGHQALENDLANELQMSRTPVREALIRLQNEGLIALLPRQGMRVLPLSLRDMREIYEALTCLETAAAELAAARKPAAAELADMRQAVEEMDVALDSHDLDRWAEADERFHRLLLEKCGNRRIAALAFTMWDQVHRARMLSMRLLPLPRRSNHEHRALVDALAAGDVASAREIHHGQRVRASRDITDALSRFHVSTL